VVILVPFCFIPRNLSTAAQNLVGTVIVLLSICGLIQAMG
jgi:hypothetical protein